MTETLPKKTSGFMVSIGTGQALETILTPDQAVYDPDREFEKHSLYAYNEVWINIRTLIRNMIQSYDAPDLYTALPTANVSADLMVELEVISGLFSNSGTEVVFYNPTYSEVTSRYAKLARLRRPKTTKQNTIHHVTESVLEGMKKNNRVLKTNSHLPFGKEKDVLVLTHYPWDLLSYDRAKSLYLLESSTGAIKPRAKWNTKYYPMPNEDMTFLPFMEYLLTIFGDKVMFAPESSVKRKDLLSQLKRKHVHPLTSEFSMQFLTK